MTTERITLWLSVCMSIYVIHSNMFIFTTYVSYTNTCRTRKKNEIKHIWIGWKWEWERSDWCFVWKISRKMIKIAIVGFFFWNNLFQAGILAEADEYWLNILITFHQNGYQPFFDDYQPWLFTLWNTRNRRRRRWRRRMHKYEEMYQNIHPCNLMLKQREFVGISFR